MPAPVARINDEFQHLDNSGGGGNIISASATTFENGSLRGLARIGDAGYCSKHREVAIATGSINVFVDHLGVARLGDSMSCGAVITTASVSIFAI